MAPTEIEIHLSELRGMALAQTAAINALIRAAPAEMVAAAIQELASEKEVGQIALMNLPTPELTLAKFEQNLQAFETALLNRAQFDKRLLDLLAPPGSSG